MKRGRMRIVVVNCFIKIIYFYWLGITKSNLFLGTPTKNTNRMSPTLSGASGSTDSFSDRQFIAITSEKQARVVALPSQNCVYRQQIADTDYVVKAEIISLKGTQIWVFANLMEQIVTEMIPFSDSVCLICYISTGHLLGYSLPSLRPLMDDDFLPLADLRYLILFVFILRFFHIFNNFVLHLKIFHWLIIDITISGSRYALWASYEAKYQCKNFKKFFSFF